MKENRAVSFIIILFVYIIASASGIISFLLLPFSLWLNLLISDVIATGVTFIFSVIFSNASVYDPYWSVQPFVILVSFAMFNKLNALKIVTIIVVGVWAIRLTANWAYTFKNLNNQDWRYTMLKEKTKKFYPIINFIGIHLVPTLVVYACTLPAVMVLTSSVSGNAFSYVFLTLSLFATLFQGVSDYQLHKFKKYRKDEKFIRVGLWKHSRHPNYLGEILMWWGIGLSAFFSLSYSPYLLIGAVLNTLLFFFVSIPMADGKQSKKEGFEEYKNQTRKLLPIKKFK